MLNEMPSPPRRSFVGFGTAIAIATVVVAAIGVAAAGTTGVSRWLLIGLGALYLLVAIAGVAWAERRAPIWRSAALVALVALSAAAIVTSGGNAMLVAMPTISMFVLFVSVRSAIGVAIATAGFVAFVVATGPYGPRGIVPALAGTGASASFVIVFSRLLRRERDARAEIEALAQQLSVYAARVEELATNQERARIAREMHDSLGHFLTAAHVQLEAARNVIDQEPTRAKRSLARSQELIAEGLREVRRAVTAMRQPVADRPFAIAMEELLAETRAAGLAVALTIEGDERPLPPAIEFALYRAAQEALTNVKRHARARRVDLTLRYVADAIALEVRDDGDGAQEGPRGFGLIGLGERVALLGGAIEITSQPHAGFTLTARIPT